MQNGFANGTRLLGNPLAREVLHRHDDFQPIELGICECPSRELPNRGWRDTSTACAPSHPVSKIRELVVPLNSIETTAAEIVLTPVNRKRVPATGSRL
jgi:hypothetical protein